MVVAAYIYPSILDSILLPGAAMFLGLAGVTLFHGIRAWKEKVSVVKSEKI
jgi:hypothetical protein